MAISRIYSSGVVFPSLLLSSTSSSANFIFVSSDKIEGGEYYRKLKEKKILVRHFDKERISPWCRVSIGTKEQMEAYLKATKEILEDKA